MKDKAKFVSTKSKTFSGVMKWLCKINPENEKTVDEICCDALVYAVSVFKDTGEIARVHRA